MVHSCKMWRISKTDCLPMYKFECYKLTKLQSTENARIKPRSGHRIVCSDTSVYCIGGCNPDMIRDLRRQLFCEVWKYNFITRKWIKFKTEHMPKELASCSVILSGGLLFLYCGTGLPFGDVLNDSIYYCKLPKLEQNISFQEIKTNSLVRPPPQYGHSIALIGSYLYTIGGTDGHAYSMDVYRLNIQTSVWEQLYSHTSDGGNGPSPRYRHEVVYFKDRLFVFGGGTSVYSCTLVEIPAFNIKTNKWETFKSIADDTVRKYPGCRKYHACVQNPYNPAIVFINGGADKQRHYNDTWMINLNTFKWTYMPSLKLPYELFFHSASVTPDGRMVIFGGTSNATDPPSRTADLFSAWITIPKLADMCWDALTFYAHKGVLSPPKDIKSLGLPLKFINKLRNSNLAA